MLSKCHPEVIVAIKRWEENFWAGFSKQQRLFDKFKTMPIPEQPPDYQWSVGRINDQLLRHHVHSLMSQVDELFTQKKISAEKSYST
jgi:hypothetical protein